MVDLTKIDTIIFDLGGVIVDLDPDAVILKLAEHVDVVPSDEMRDFIVGSPALIKYETGKIPEDQFLLEINELLHGQMTMEEFEEAWNLMLHKIPNNRLNLMKKLGANFQTMILSNTNGMHERKFNEIVKGQTGEEGMHSFVQIAHYSHNIGLRKPEATCYQFVIDHSSLNPARTLFLDDNVKNIDSAKAIGIHAIRVEYPDQIFEILANG